MQEKLSSFMSRNPAGLCLAFFLICAGGFELSAWAADTDEQALPPGALVRLGAHRFLHKDTVRSLAFTPDGAGLVTEAEGNILLWDLKSAKVIREYRTGYPKISADGRSVAFGNTEKKSVQVLDVTTGQSKASLLESKFALAGHRPIISGTRLACNDQGELVVWDVAQGKELRRWKPGQSSQKIVPLEFSPDGRRIALLYSGEANEASQIWLHGIAEEGGSVQLDGVERVFSPWLVFSPDGKWLAGPCEVSVPRGHQTSFRIWDTATGKTLNSRLGSFNAGAFSPDGTQLAVSTYRDVQVHDIASGKELVRVAETQERIGALAFSPDGKTLAVAQEKRVRLWETQNWQELLPGKGHQEMVTALVISPDNRTIVTGGLDGRIIFWSWPEGQEKSRTEAVGSNFGVKHLNFSPDGRTLAATAWVNGGANGTLFDASNGKLLLKFGKERPFACPVVFLPGGKELLTAGGRNLSVWDATAGNLVRSYDFSTNSVVAAQLVPGEDQVWWAGERQSLGLKDLKTGENVRQLAGGRHSFSPQLKLSANGAWLAVDNRVWDLTTGKVAFEGRGDASVSAFSSDSRFFAYVIGREVMLWETLTQKEIHLFPTDIDNRKGALAFSPDGKILVTSDNATALVWDMTGRLQQGQLPKLTPTPAEMEMWWRTLGSNDHWEACRAAWSFAAAGEVAVAFIAVRLSPAKDFDAEQFPLLPISAKYRPPRAVMALEYNATPAARGLLEDYARGQAEAPLTRAAKAALGRLSNLR